MASPDLEPQADRSQVLSRLTDRQLRGLDPVRLPVGIEDPYGYTPGRGVHVAPESNFVPVPESAGGGSMKPPYATAVGGPAEFVPPSGDAEVLSPLGVLEGIDQLLRIERMTSD